MYLRDDITRGNGRIRSVIQTYVEKCLTQYIPLAWQQWGLDENTLPLPKSYEVEDPIESLNYPNVGCYITGATGFNTLELTDTGATPVNYVAELTLFVMTRTAYLGVDGSGIDKWEKPYRESSIRQRDDYMSLLRKAIHHSPSFETAGSDYPIVCDMSTWRESFDEPIKVADNRNPMWVCAGSVTVSVKVTDHSFEFDLGSLRRVELDTDHL